MQYCEVSPAERRKQLRLTKEQMEFQLREYWMSRREAAAALGSTGEWVHALAKQGRLETIETGIGKLYSKQDVERLASERKGK